MSGDDISKSQAKVIQKALFPGTNYLVRLRTRMEKAGFSQHDKLYKLVQAACDSSLQLANEIHYLTCDGAMRQPRKT